LVDALGRDLDHRIDDLGALLPNRQLQIIDHDSPQPLNDNSGRGQSDILAMCRLNWTGLVHNSDTIWSWHPVSNGLRLPVIPDLESEDFKQLLDQLAVARACDNSIHTVAKLHQS